MSDTNEIIRSMAGHLKLANARSLIEKWNIACPYPGEHEQWWAGMVERSREAVVAPSDAVREPSWGEEDEYEEPGEVNPNFLTAYLPRGSMTSGFYYDGPFDELEDAVAAVLISWREDALERAHLGEEGRKLVDELNADIKSLGGDESSSLADLPREQRELYEEYQSTMWQVSGAEKQLERAAEKFKGVLHRMDVPEVKKLFEDEVGPLKKELEEAKKRAAALEGRLSPELRELYQRFHPGKSPGPEG